ncbi:MAG: nuclear transport factor 2 family protein [Acidimicrobiia bacterium]
MADGSTNTDLANLAARLRRLEDIEEIRLLFESYCYHLDRGHFAEYAALYAEQGQMRLGPARADGRENIEKAVQEHFGGGATAREQGRLGGLHIVSSPRIELDGDRATGEVMWTVIVRDAEGKPFISSVGHHVDELVREDGRWRFQKRKGFIDMPDVV